MTSGTTEHWAGPKRRTLLTMARMRWRALLRSRIRNDDVGLAVTAAVIGGSVALAVAAVRLIVVLLHHVLFGVGFESHLSDPTPIDPWRLLLVPALGGLAYGL